MCYFPDSKSIYLYALKYLFVPRLVHGIRPVRRGGAGCFRTRGKIGQIVSKSWRFWLREESFITRWGGGRLHFHVVGKTFDDPPPNPFGKKFSTPPDIWQKCLWPPSLCPAPKHHCFILAALNEGSYILLGTTYLNCILIYYQLQNYIAFQLLNELTTKHQRIIGPVSLTWVLRTC